MDENNSVGVHNSEVLSSVPLPRPHLFVPKPDDFAINPHNPISIPPLDLNSKPEGTLSTPAPTKRIRFADGKVVALNRHQRRAMHIYNRDLVGGRK